MPGSTSGRSQIVLLGTHTDLSGPGATYGVSSSNAVKMRFAVAQGGVTEGLYAMRLTDMPYRDTLSSTAQVWFDCYKARFSAEPNIGAVYGHVAADLTVLGIQRAGPDLNVDSLITDLVSIKGYHDIFNGPEQNFGPDKHQGASSLFLAVVKNGRRVRLTEPLVF
jgi:branched-chain amino acid transport system substrate-binding protein